MYVFIDEDIVDTFIRVELFEYESNDYSKLVLRKLLDYFITYQTVGIYSPITYYHMNCFAENISSYPPDVFANYFEYGENLKYNEEAMKKDIETYVLYTYEDLQNYISRERFELLPFKYVKVLVGKGILTFEELIDILALINQEF